jgi:hypothetical protein
MVSARHLDGARRWSPVQAPGAAPAARLRRRHHSLMRFFDRAGLIAYSDACAPADVRAFMFANIRRCGPCAASPRRPDINASRSPSRAAFWGTALSYSVGTRDCSAARAASSNCSSSVALVPLKPATTLRAEEMYSILRCTDNFGASDRPAIYARLNGAGCLHPSQFPRAWSAARLWALRFVQFLPKGCSLNGQPDKLPRG